MLGEVEEVGGDEGDRLDQAQQAKHRVHDLDRLRRVGPGAELVEQHHRARRRGLEEGAQAHHLGAEAALGLVRAIELDDRGEEPVDERHPGPGGRRVEARLSKHLRDPDRLQQARLAARVGAGDEGDPARLVERDVGRHRALDQRQQQRIEQADELEPGLWFEHGQADREAPGPSAIGEAARREVDLEMAQKLDDPRQRRGDLVIDAHHQAVNEVVRTQVVAVVDHTQTVPPPAQRAAVVGVALELPQPADLEVAQTTVGTNERLELKGRHPLGVLEQVRHASERRRAANLFTEPPDPAEPRARALEGLRHQRDGVSERAQHIEPEAHRSQTGVVSRRAQQRQQTRESHREALGRAPKVVRCLELGQDRLPVADGLELGRRSRQHPLEEIPMRRDAVALDLDPEATPDHLGEEEIGREVLRHPRGRAGRHAVQLVVELSGAGAAEKGEVEQVEERLGVGIGASSG